MSIKIEILLGDNQIDGVFLDAHMSVLGFSRYPLANAIQEATSDIGPLTSHIHMMPDAPAPYEPEEPKAEKPKRTRKTKDEASEKNWAALGERIEEAKALTAVQAEEVVKPEAVDPVVTPEEATQDAADEAAEVAGLPLTHDDVRNAMGRYVKAFGMAAAQADGEHILGYKPISSIPEDKLVDCIEKVNAAIESNPFDRARVS